MSDDDRVRGPTMLAATNMLKPPPAVIGSVNRELTLPRTVRLTTVIALIIGGVLGFLVAFFIFGPSLKALLYGPAAGGGIGWATVNFSPLPGESLARWLGLQLNTTRKGKLVVNGRPARLYVGIAPLRRTAAGTIRMLPGGVPVDAVSWDSRGVPQQSIPGADRLTAPRASAVPKAKNTNPKRPGRSRQARKHARQATMR